jgi:glycosyltransferase involved in cell wall biosynthesis
MIDAFFAEHNDYVAVHGHMAALGRDYLAAAERVGIPNRFSHSHIADFERNPRGYLKRIFEKGFGIHSTKRFACSRWAGKYMYGNKPFIVINNGIDTAYFAYDSIGRAKFRTSLSITDDEPLVGNVGRLELMKNQEFLIDVFAAMVHKGFPGKLVLAGDGSLRTKIENRVRLKGVSNRVILLGVYEDMPSFYAGIDLFIMTSIFEGLPFSAIEAQCSGLPCVLSDSISTECKVTNNVNFESLDSDANLWADLVITMLEASTPREDASLAVSNAGYDIKDTVRLLQEYYEGR